MQFRDSVVRLVHCDWGSNRTKRQICVANRTGAVWRIDTLDEAGDPSTLLTRLRSGLNAENRLVVGFDFPIGLPYQYAKKAKISSFLDALGKVGNGVWEDFFLKTDKVDELSINRPFYPKTGKPKGSTSVEKYSAKLDLDWQLLFRDCERKTAYRNPASPLFWTIGAKQVGTAAISGWQEILKPLTDDPESKFKIWPFEGTLDILIENGFDVIVETYPGESYSHLNFPRHWNGKTSQIKRKERSTNFFDWAEKSRVVFSDAIAAQISDGFGGRSSGEDPFDALVGVCSMIDVIDGRRAEGSYKDLQVQEIEGWIFGQNATGSAPD